jgi:hypothetical protein
LGEEVEVAIRNVHTVTKDPLHPDVVLPEPIHQPLFVPHLLRGDEERLFQEDIPSEVKS